ncbi:MAG: 4-hydroxybenzoate octaprenyltransferase [Gammaproteobacteria bacterium]
MINIPNIKQIDIEKLGIYARLIRLDKPVGIFLLLWPTLWALFIASNGIPSIKHLVIFTLGVILMRSAGCAINDYADRDIDPHISRTRKRPIASGELEPEEGLFVFVLLVFSAFLLVLFLNRLTFYFAIGGALLAATYPFMKRIHFLPQVHLGVAFAWSVPMAFTAVSNDYPPPIAWLIFTCAVLWTTAYDTMYAMADREEDIKIGVKSTAILFGPLDKFAIGLMQLLVIVCLILIGMNAKLSWAYYAGVSVGLGFFIYQQVLIKHRFADRCFFAFLNNQYFGLVIFIGILGHYLLQN